MTITLKYYSNVTYFIHIDVIDHCLYVCLYVIFNFLHKTTKQNKITKQRKKNMNTFLFALNNKSYQWKFLEMC